MTRDLRRMIAGLTLERFEKRTEWPLAIVAVIFLAAYSVQVLAQPHGRLSLAIDLVIVITYAAFVVDYLARLSLATDRPRWFLRHLVDLAVIALPLLRPLRLLRLLVLFAGCRRPSAERSGAGSRPTLFPALSCSSTPRHWPSWRPNGDSPARRSPTSVTQCGGRSPP